MAAPPRLHYAAVRESSRPCPVAPPALAQSVLSAVFTPIPIQVDGVAEQAWSQARPQNIAICMNPALTQQLTGCAVTGTVQALWNGPLLYLLFTVTDPDITTASGTDTNRSSVQIYVDQYNDKFPKFEEDDSDILISAAGQQTGNATNNDYADNAEGDAIVFEGAKPIYACLGVPQNLALDLDMGNTGHSPCETRHGYAR